MARKHEKDETRKRITDWFAGERADQLPRRHEVWALLGWYHTKVVEPQLGFFGMLRRWWWMATGRTGKLSPWREILERAHLVRAHNQLQAAIAAGVAQDGVAPADLATQARAD